jgi:L-iditol 2-dehydrogenase
MVESMIAVRLHGPRDLRVERVARPARERPDDVLVGVRAVGICGSDLLAYQDAQLADVLRGRPLVLGHEVCGVVAEAPDGALGGDGAPLRTGALVAVDPAEPCGACERCRAGDPNLCAGLRFRGLHPDDGGLREWLYAPARNCYPLPAGLGAEVGALTEPLGVALHATDLAHLRVGESVAILGAGPLGLCILQVARLAGAGPILVSDKLPWRLALAERCGATPVNCGDDDPVRRVLDLTGGRGVDVAIEAAWADHSIQQAAEMCRPGGRVVLVGIPRDDRLTLSHGVARRKGLTIRLCRRMKHAYLRAIRLVACGAVDVAGLVSHRFPLPRTPEAFALNAAYHDGVVKVIVHSEEETR